MDPKAFEIRILSRDLNAEAVQLAALARCSVRAAKKAITLGPDTVKRGVGPRLAAAMHVLGVEPLRRTSSPPPANRAA